MTSRLTLAFDHNLRHYNLVATQRRRLNHHRGWAVQLEPMKPMLKARANERLILKHAGARAKAWCLLIRA